jgi:hypothetical protein
MAIPEMIIIIAITVCFENPKLNLWFSENKYKLVSNTTIEKNDEYKTLGLDFEATFLAPVLK